MEPSRSADNLVSELDALFPNDISWLIASYDDELKEICQQCKCLLMKREGFQCDECEFYFHTWCAGSWLVPLSPQFPERTYCAVCYPTFERCVKCDTPIRTQDLKMSCKVCKSATHVACCCQRPGNGCCDEPYCIEIYWQNPRECSDCSADVSTFTSEDELDFLTEPRTHCPDCEEKHELATEARRKLLCDKLTQMGIRLWWGYVDTYVDSYAEFVNDGKGDLYDVARSVCEYHFTNNFCQVVSCFRELEEKQYLPRGLSAHSAAIEFWKPLMPENNTDWPWLQGLTPEQFQSTDHYQKHMQSLGRHLWLLETSVVRSNWK